MPDNTKATTERTAQTPAVRSATRAWPVFAAILLGAFIIYGVGFASPATLHNAAHDSRHSFAFPCH